MRPAIDAQQLSKRFVLRHNPNPSLKSRFLGLLHRGQREVHEDFWALRDLTLTVGRGESLGLVGRNGSGKSTFLKLVAGIHRPTSGRLLVPAKARIGSMIELGVGFHPDLNGTENVFLNAAINGLTREEIHDIYPAIVEYSGLEPFMDVPLKTYSSGMHMRLGFAIAANLNPDILLLDEIFAVGDGDFQRQCMKTIRRFASEGRTLLFVSHATTSVRAICGRVCVLDQGRLLFDGDVDEGLAEYQHVAAAASRAAPAASPVGPQSTGEPDQAGGGDDRAGDWALALLEREGLQPHHRVLEVTCGALTGSAGLARYVGPERYQHWEITVLSPPVRAFDYAIMSPLLSRLSLNMCVRVLAVARRAMTANGRVYAAWIEQEDAIDVGDTAPFAYPFDLVAGMAGAVGLRASRLPPTDHPAGDSVLVLERA